MIVRTYLLRVRMVWYGKSSARSTQQLKQCIVILVVGVCAMQTKIHASHQCVDSMFLSFSIVRWCKNDKKQQTDLHYAKRRMGNKCDGIHSVLIIDFVATK